MRRTWIISLSVYETLFFAIFSCFVKEKKSNKCVIKAEPELLFSFWRKGKCNVGDLCCSNLCSLQV